MLVFSGFTPHSPLLLPSINPDNIHQVDRTRHAIQRLADELYASQPDTLLLITEHPTRYARAFSFTVSDPYTFDLREFGDLGFDRAYHPDIPLINHLQESLRAQEQPVTLTTDDDLHYASAIPIALMTESLPHVRLAPLTYADLDAKAHFAFGQAMKDAVFQSQKRIAVIAAGDMSHALSEDAPAGYAKEGQKYDQTVIDLISQKNSAGLLRMDAELIEKAHEMSHRPLSVLFGLLDRVGTTPEILSYESPFGVGYLVAHFAIK